MGKAHQEDDSVLFLMGISDLKKSFHPVCQKTNLGKYFKDAQNKRALDKTITYSFKSTILGSGKFRSTDIKPDGHKSH